MGAGNVADAGWTKKVRRVPICQLEEAAPIKGARGRSPHRAPALCLSTNPDQGASIDWSHGSLTPQRVSARASSGMLSSWVSIAQMLVSL